MILYFYIRVSGGAHKVQTMRVVPGDRFRVNKQNKSGRYISFLPKSGEVLKLQSSWVLIKSTYVFNHLEDGTWEYEKPMRPNSNIYRKPKQKEYDYSKSKSKSC